MRRSAFLCLALFAFGLTACSDGGARVTDVGDCDLVVERMVCLPAMPAPQCHSEALLVTRKTPQCLKKPA